MIWGALYIPFDCEMDRPILDCNVGLLQLYLGLFGEIYSNAHTPYIIPNSVNSGATCFGVRAIHSSQNLLLVADAFADHAREEDSSSRKRVSATPSTGAKARMELTDDGLALLWLLARDFSVERVRTRRRYEDWIGVDIYWDVGGEERCQEIGRMVDEVAENEHAVLRYGGWLHLNADGVRDEVQTLRTEH